MLNMIPEFISRVGQSFECHDSLQPSLTDKQPNNPASFFPPAKKAMKLKRSPSHNNSSSVRGSITLKKP